MSITDNDFLRPSVTFITDAVEALPLDASNFPDLSDMGDSLGDVVSTVVTTGGRAGFGVVRVIRRHPSAAGIALLALLAGVAAAMWMRSRSVDEPALKVAQAA
jgi:hypothetical protein